MKIFNVSRIFDQIVFGANIATVIAMFVTGFSYLIDPAPFPYLSLLGLVFPFFLIVNVLFMLFWTFVRWRNIFLSFFSLILCYVPASMYVGINRAQELPSDCIKVMSYNALSFRGLPGQELRCDSNALAYYLIQQDCDIVCLQEATLNYLSEGMREKLKAVYPYSQTVSMRDNSQSILSKYEIVGTDTVPYESHGNFSMAYRLKGKCGEILVVNNHFETNNFSLEEKEQFGSMMHGKMDKQEMKAQTKSVVTKLADAVKIRNPQAKAVAQYVMEHKGERIILCGDFNEWPVSFTHNVIARNLTDCFIASGQGLGWSYAHHAMRVRIDNIMCSEDFVPYGCYVDSSVHFSDHYPIVSWMKLRGEQ